jgi:hypothetical protein
MKKILFVMALSLVISGISTSQVRGPLANENFGFELGLSGLTGISFDVSFGYVKRVDPDDWYSKVVSGWFFTYSVWQPHWSEPTPNGDEGYFNWFTPTSKIEHSVGQGFGLKYLTDKFGIGVMIDHEKVNTYQNYVSPATGWSWHWQLNEEDKYGVTLALSACLYGRLWFSGYVGTVRPLMVGVLIVL